MNPDAVVALVSSTFMGNSSQEAAMLRSPGQPMPLQQILVPSSMSEQFLSLML
jgi:hypothetical protein